MLLAINGNTNTILHNAAQIVVNTQEAVNAANVRFITDPGPGIVPLALDPNSVPLADMPLPVAPNILVVNNLGVLTNNATPGFSGITANVGAKQDSQQDDMNRQSPLAITVPISTTLAADDTGLSNIPYSRHEKTTRNSSMTNLKTWTSRRMTGMDEGF